MTLPNAYAIRLHQTGGPEVLQVETAPPRAPGPGEVLVRQTAVGVNFIDTYHRTGLYRMPLPFIPGSEGAGVIDEVGEGVVHVEPGDRVAYTGRGTYATHYTGPAAGVVPLPAGISDEEAAAVLLKGMTAWMLLEEIRPLQKGETALVWAPVGGVGSLLTPWAKHLGARVIAVTSSAAKAERAKALGADEVVVGYDDVTKQVRALTNGKGVDVVYDSVGKISAETSLSSLRPRGWFITYGNASGAADPIPPGRLAAGGSLVMTRPTLFNFTDTPESLARASRRLFSLIEKGVLSADIGQRFSLKDAAEAHRALESGTTTGATLLMP
ncbi:quinone oxidoreductase family protein [Hyphomonas sp.]|jgi:NADPH2:quinone reductase|uniref:quinone oxidoreductase family protein n=1 Tax=Hyphomonas sp. TaxID=87 RepID=UPI0037C0E21A